MKGILFMKLVKGAPSRLVMGLVGFLLVFSLAVPAQTRASGPQAQANDLGGYVNAQPLDVDIADDTLGYVPGEVMVKLKSSDAVTFAGGKLVATSPGLAEMMRCFQLSAASEVLPGVYKLSGQGGSSLDVKGAAAALEATGLVSYAGPNYTYHAMLAPNDEQYLAGQQWGITQIKAEQAWDITTGAENIVIAILDTGTAPNHPDLDGKVIPGYDAYNNDNDPSDDNGHGTYTAGIAGASSNNGTGIVGTSWGARLMPVKVLGPRGQGSDETIARGIRWAADNGARIISASLGGDIDSQVMRDAVKYAHDKNVLLVASSGNTPDGKPNFPAAYESALAVGATGRSDTFTGFSSWGPFVDVTAPGVGILSTGWDNGTLSYEYGNGTSASCPFVSGIAALVLSVNPSLTADQVKWIIEDSSDDFGPPGFDENYGRGRVNAFRAVQMAQQGPPPTRTPTPVAQPSATAAPTFTPAARQGPTLQLDTKEVAPGALLAIIGAGFGPNEIIDLTIRTADGNGRSIGNAQTDAQGGFRAEVALPADIPPGAATLTASGPTSGLRASVELSVGTGGGGGGQSVIRGTVRGATLEGVTVRLKPSLGVAGPEQTTQPDGNGVFTFSRLASGIYALSASAAGGLPVGPFSVQVDGSAADIKTIDITLAAARPKAFDNVARVANTPQLVFFPEVAHTLKGPFLKFWRENGGLPIFGYPLSEEFQEISPTDGKTYTVQYFERNRFEHHPEFAGTRNEVLMGLLGIEMTRGRTFPPGAPFQSTPTQAYFNETKHSLSGPFLKYWQSHGGLPIFGYPISEELVENGFLVQYFERNRFEYHPEFANTPNDVLLGLLGVEIVKRNGWLAP
jgi:subtilisin family serine protease